jgi:hypothetical protein
VPPDPATVLNIPPSFRLDLYPSGFVLRKPPAVNAALQPGSAAAMQAQRDGVLHPYDRSTRPFLQVSHPTHTKMQTQSHTKHRLEHRANTATKKTHRTESRSHGRRICNIKALT